MNKKTTVNWLERIAITIGFLTIVALLITGYRMVRDAYYTPSEAKEDSAYTSAEAYVPPPKPSNSTSSYKSINTTPPKIYTIKAGDNLSTIASNYNVALSKLAEVNNIFDHNTIFMGEILKIPN